MDWWPRIAVGTSLWALLLAPVLLSTFVLAHLAHRFVEEPARERLRRAVPVRRPAADAVQAAPAQPRVAVRAERPLTPATAALLAGRNAGVPRVETVPVPAQRPRSA
jgi:hypothetical protein